MTGRAKAPPVLVAIRRLGSWTWALLVLGAIVVAVVALALVNPGDRIGPVQPAEPPVGGPELPPATAGPTG